MTASTQVTAGTIGVPLLTLAGVAIAVRVAQVSRAASASSVPAEALSGAAGA